MLRLGPRSKRWLLRLGGAGLVGVLLLGALLASLNHAVVRAGLTTVANRELLQLFQGKLQIGSIERVTWNGLGVANVSLRDSEDRVVLEATRLDVELPGFVQLFHLATRRSPNFVLRKVTAGHAEVRLLTNPTTNQFSLVEAFELRKTSVTSPSTGSSRPFQVWLPQIELDDVNVHLGQDKHTAPNTAAQSATSGALSARFNSARGSVHVGAAGVSVDVEQAAIAMSSPSLAYLRGTGTFKLRPGPSYAGTFDGDFTGIPLQARAHYDNAGKLNIQLTAPKVPPEAARALIANWPLSEAVELQATLRGPLEKLALRTTLESEHSFVEGKGVASWQHETFALELDLDATALDAKAFHPDAPHTALDAEAHLSVSVADTGWHAELTGETRATAVADFPVPPSHFRLSVDPTTTLLNLDVNEPGAAANIELRFEPNGAIRGHWSVPRLDLRRQRHIQADVKGSGSLQGDILFSNQSLKSSTQIKLANLEFGALQIHDASASLRSSPKFTGGPFNSTLVPLEVELKAPSISLLGTQFNNAILKFTGSAASGDLKLTLASAGLDAVSLEGKLGISEGVFRDGNLVVRRNSTTLSAQLKELDLAQGRASIPAFTISGPQLELGGEVRYGPGVLEAHLAGANLSLRRITELIASKNASTTSSAAIPRIGGEADITADITIGPDLSRAQIRTQLRNLSVADIGRTTLDATLLLSGRDITGSVLGKDDLVGHFSAGLSAALADSPLTSVAYRDATGSLALSVDEVPLENLALLSQSALELDPQGKLGIRLQLTRESSRAFPDLSLQLGVPSFTANVPSLSEARLPPYSLYSRLEYEDASHELSLSSVISDAAGALANLDTHWDLDAGELITSPRPDQLLAAARLRSKFYTSPRAISSFPIKALREIPGELQCHLEASGSLESPVITGGFSAKNLVTATSAATPLSLQGQVNYSAESQQATLEVSASFQQHTPLLASYRATFPWNGAPYHSAVHSDFEVALDHFPLELAPTLPDQALRGSASGRLLWNSDDDGLLAVQVSLADIFLGTTPLGTGQLKVNGRAQNVAGTFSLNAGPSQLLIDLAANLPLNHFPSQAQVHEFTANVSAREFPAAAISPIISDTLPRLDGKLAADFTLAHTGVEKDATPGTQQARTTLNGTAALSDGSLFVDALGLEIQGVSLTAIARPEGSATLLELREIQGRARADDTNLRAQAFFSLELPQLNEGRIQAVLDRVPLTLKGQSLGTATGKLDASLHRRHGWNGPAPLNGVDYVEVEVNVGPAQIYGAASAARSLIALEPNREIIVRQQKLRPPGPPPIPYRVRVTLGDEVRFAFADQELPLGGSIALDYTDTAQVAGTVNLLPGGRLLILNRVFEVEYGALRLNPREIANPDLNLSLRGRGSDGEAITVNVAGTWREPITDPAPAELQRILGGGTETALSSGMQVLGLGALLGGAVQLRLGEGDSAQAKANYSATVQLDDNLWFEANYQKATSDALGRSGDSALSGTLDYRFQNHWSLRTKVGTNTGSLDLAWQYRY